MNEYLLLFRNSSAENGYLLTPEDMARDLPAWQAWIGNIALQGKLVQTQPIEYGGTIVRIDGTVEGPHKSGDQQLVTGFLICKAESLEEVRTWSRSCPILNYPNGSVEIRPAIPFPQQ